LNTIAKVKLKENYSKAQQNHKENILGGKGQVYKFLN
jgi:hypothetical protein